MLSVSTFTRSDFTFVLSDFTFALSDFTFVLSILTSLHRPFIFAHIAW
jgi:hypothetical protein